MNPEFPETAWGNMQLASAEDLERDAIGFTNPNLHRRIDLELQSDELHTRSYQIGIYDSVHSTRTTEVYVYEDEINPDEIP